MYKVAQWMSPKSLNWVRISPWWRHNLETLSALLALCDGNPPTRLRAVTESFLWHKAKASNADFDVFFDIRLQTVGMSVISDIMSIIVMST